MMIEDFIETSRNSTPAVSQKLDKKVLSLRKVPVTESNTRKFDGSHVLLRLHHFAARCLRNLHSKQRKNGQIPAKKRL